MTRKFNPTYDVPASVDDALAMLRQWADPTCFTFSADRARAMYTILAEAVAQDRQRLDHLQACAVQHFARELSPNVEYVFTFAWRQRASEPCNLRHAVDLSLKTVDPDLDIPF